MWNIKVTGGWRSVIGATRLEVLVSPHAVQRWRERFGRCGTIDEAMKNAEFIGIPHDLGVEEHYRHDGYRAIFVVERVTGVDIPVVKTVMKSSWTQKRK